MTRDTGSRLAKVVPESDTQDPFDSEPTLDRAIQARIGDQLRAMYDDLVQQPVPDRFAELLGRLEQRDEESAR